MTRKVVELGCLQQAVGPVFLHQFINLCHKDHDFDAKVVNNSLNLSQQKMCNPLFCWSSGHASTSSYWLDLQLLSQYLNIASVVLINSKR